MIGNGGGQETTWSQSPDWPSDRLYLSSKALEVRTWCKYIKNKTNASFQGYASFFQDGLFFINWKFTDDLLRAATAAHLDALQRENFLQFKHSMVFKSSFFWNEKKEPKTKSLYYIHAHSGSFKTVVSILYDVMKCEAGSVLCSPAMRRCSQLDERLAVREVERGHEKRTTQDVWEIWKRLWHYANLKLEKAECNSKKESKQKEKHIS